MKSSKKSNVDKLTVSALNDEEEGEEDSELERQMLELEEEETNNEDSLGSKNLMKRQLTVVRMQFDQKLAKQRTQMKQDVDLVAEIRQKVQAAVKKWKKQKKEIVEVLRADVKFQVGVHVNETIEQMNKLKDVIALDMKKWASQRSDLQIEIRQMNNRLDRFKGLTKVRGEDPVFISNEKFNPVFKPFQSSNKDSLELPTRVDSSFFNETAEQMTAFSPDFTNPLISERTHPSHNDALEISDIFKSTSQSKRKVIKFKIPDEKSQTIKNSYQNQFQAFSSRILPEENQGFGFPKRE